jgi:hypothetical protein
MVTATTTGPGFRSSCPHRCIKVCSRDSSVGIATYYGPTERSEFQSHLSRKFSLRIMLQTGPGAHPSSCPSRYRGTAQHTRPRRRYVSLMQCSLAWVSALRTYVVTVNQVLGLESSSPWALQCGRVVADSNVQERQKRGEGS